eukprot:1698484-Alexandrium_andersonii.AAC.1
MLPAATNTRKPTVPPIPISAILVAHDLVSKYMSMSVQHRTGPIEEIGTRLLRTEAALQGSSPIGTAPQRRIETDVAGSNRATDVVIRIVKAQLPTRRTPEGRLRS